MKTPDWWPGVRDRWQSLSPRERHLALAATLAIGAALTWSIGIAPALRVLRQADAQHQALEAQSQQMRTLQAQAAVLQAQPRVSHDDAVRALETSVRQRLGPGAQISVAGERATVTLRATSADALAAWLSQARVNARAVPVEMRLARGAAVTGGVTWDGSLVLSLPPR